MGLSQFVRNVLPLPFTFPSSGLASALAGQLPGALGLKLEKRDKDDMNHLSNDDKSDDEGDRKNMMTPRGGTRTR